jgi:Bacterial membrane protein YfhO
MAWGSRVRGDRAAAGLVALLVLVYLWPALVGGKILSANAILYGFPPWQEHTPRELGSFLNQLLIDPPTADYPWRWFARGLIREGTLPAWNPHVLAGTPFFSNPQTGIFSPFSLPLWILPLNYAIGLGAALKLWFGGFGAYLLARRLRLGFLPGLLAGVSYALASINVVWLTHETLPAVAVMLPWMLWLTERIFERGRLGSALWLAVATAAALGGGHPGMQLHVMVAAGLYALLRMAFASGSRADARALLRPLALTAGGLALGALLMAIMLIPEALSSRDTVGTAARHGTVGALPGSIMPLGAIKSVLFPDWWGRPSGLEASFRGIVAIVNFNERTFYAGVVALLLALVGLAARGGWRRKAPFAVLAFIGLAIPLHAPLLYPLVQHLPGLEVVQNQRLHFVFELGTAVLAAFGLQAVLDRPAGERARLAVGAVAVAIGVAAIVATHASATDAGHVLQHFLTGRDYQSDRVLALTSVAWFLLLAAGVGVALLVAWVRPAWRAGAAVALVALAAFDMLHVVHGYQPVGPASKVTPPRTRAIAYLQRHAREGRFIGVGAVLPNDWPLVYGLDDVRGYDPPQPTKRYYGLWLTANPGQVSWRPFEIGALDALRLRLVSVLGVRYIVTGAGSGLAPKRDPALGALDVVHADDDATIFANPGAAPRAMVARTVRLTADEEATRAALIEEGIDARRTVVVERDQPGAGALRGARGSAAVVRERNAQVTLRATLDRRGLVVLNDSFSDGWTVRVDGHAAPALHVNDVMRGVAVGPGRHTIAWSYAVPGLRAGVAVSALALAALLGGAIALALRRRATSRSRI